MLNTDSLSNIRSLLADHGPVYKETLTANFSHFIKEPWNGFSSLTFLVPVVFWLIKLKGHHRDYPFVMFCMPLLTIGGLGSMLFHGLRLSPYLLAMDWLPIVLLTLSVSIYFWYRVLAKWWQVVLVILGFISLRVCLYMFLKGSAGINASYFINGVNMFVPALILLRKTHNAHANWLVYAILLFMAALVFRQIDMWQVDVLPMGSHWLWHVFCGAGAFALSTYLVKIAENATDSQIKT